MRKSCVAAAVLLSSSAVLWVGLAKSAWACSLPIPAYNGRAVLPPAGATGVPTNSRVLVVYGGTALRVDSPWLRATTGIDVAAKVTMLTSGHDIYVVQPTEPLQPNTTYQVLSQVATLPCTGGTYPYPYYPLCTSANDAGSATYDAGDDGGVGPAATVISTFTTGAGPDTVAPALVGGLSHTSQKQDCDSGSCCGPYSGYLVTFSWPNANDSNPVYYELAHGDSPVFALAALVPVSGSILNADGQFFCSGMGSMLASFTGVAGDYSLVAVDLAGNRSAALLDHVMIDCNAFDGGMSDSATDTSDAALDATADATRETAGGADASSDVPSAIAPARDSSGCSCRVGGPQSRTSAIGMVVLGLMLSIRRRRRAARR
jgi:MYXO-CTERM domain-containing protein